MAVIKFVKWFITETLTSKPTVSVPAKVNRKIESPLTLIFVDVG